MDEKMVKLARQSMDGSIEGVEVFEVTPQKPGSTMMQTKTQFTAAVQIQEKRDLMIVQERCLQEASIACDDFYYSWEQGGKMIEGVTIGGALAIARNWGNDAVVCRVEELPNSYIFHGDFIDLETGFNLSRPFRQNKQSPKKKSGADIYTGDRGIDIIFQIGASKAIRNVVLNAVPKWLSNKVLAKAKEGVATKIKQMGKEKARQFITDKANAVKVEIENIEENYGLVTGWDVEKMVLIWGGLKAIEDGMEKAEVVFPAKKKKEKKKEENKSPSESKDDEAPDDVGVSTEDDKTEQKKLDL